MTKHTDLTSLHKGSVELEASDLDFDFERFRLEIFDQHFGLFGVRSGEESPRFSHALGDALLFRAETMGLADELEKEKGKYIIKIKYLSKYFDIKSLRNFRLNEVEKLHSALEVVQTALKDGRLTPKDISQTTRGLAQEILLTPVKQEKWSDRNPEIKERAIDFLVRVHGAAIREGILRRSELADTDEDLYRSINTFYSRAKKKILENPEAYADIPGWIFDWLSDTSISTSAEIDRELEELGVNTPSDVFRKELGLSHKDRQRLYDAAKRRFG